MLWLYIARNENIITVFAFHWHSCIDVTRGKQHWSIRMNGGSGWLVLMQSWACYVTTRYTMHCDADLVVVFAYKLNFYLHPCREGSRSPSQLMSLAFISRETGLLQTFWPPIVVSLQCNVETQQLALSWSTLNMWTQISTLLYDGFGQCAISALKFCRQLQQETEIPVDLHHLRWS